MGLRHSIKKYMIDKKLEGTIKEASDFIELWKKFHEIFKNTISKGHVSADKEKELLSVKNLISSRYEDLMDLVGAKPLKRFITNPSVYNILSVKNVSIMSDDRLKVLEKDWEESLRYLAALLSRLKRKKNRLEGFNRFAFALKKGISRFK